MGLGTYLRRLDAPEPGKPYLFTPGDSLAVEEAVAEIFGTPTGYLDPEANVAILPVLSSDPAPVLEGRVAATRDLERRPYGRVIAPRRRLPEVTIELLAAGRAPKPIFELLTQNGVAVPDGWQPRRRRLVSARRVAWLRVPIDARPAGVLRFVCDAVGTLAPAGAATGQYLLVRSRSSGFIGGVGQRDD